MAIQPHFLGIDIDLDGLCLALVDLRGELVGSLKRALGGTVRNQELDPQDWWRATRTGIKELLRRVDRQPGCIRAVGVTGPCDGVVLVDKQGQVLCPTILGPRDDLGVALEQLHATVGRRNLMNLAGGSADTSSAAVKLLWTRDHERKVWHHLAAVFQPRDFLRFRLTGTRVTEPSTAASSLLFNPRTRQWSKQLMALMQLSPDFFPAVHDGGHISGRVTETASREAGLSAGTPVVGGASHLVASAVAMGAIRPGAVVAELGQRGTLAAFSDTARRDNAGLMNTGCHCLDGLWSLERPRVADGRVVEWFLDEIAPAEMAQAKRNHKSPLDQLAELAAETPPGADGLIFHSPSDGVTGGFSNLGLHHRRGHLVRAMMEASAFTAAHALSPHLSNLGAAAHLHLCGPWAGNRLWCQILGDALDLPVTMVSDDTLRARGAALLAATAIGIYKDTLEACAAMVKKGPVLEPRKHAHQTYAALLATRTPPAPAPVTTVFTAPAQADAVEEDLDV